MNARQVYAMVSGAALCIGGCSADTAEEGVQQAAGLGAALDWNALDLAIDRATPQSLPPNIPAALLEVTLPGVGSTFNLDTVLKQPGTQIDEYHTVYASIKRVFRTTDTLAIVPQLGTAAAPVDVPAASGAPAAQVYGCSATPTGHAWTFLRPEAGLSLVLTSPVADSWRERFDHFRNPGGISYSTVIAGSASPGLGPAWRQTRGVPFADQKLFVAAVEANVPNAGTIPQLRLRNVSAVASGTAPPSVYPFSWGSQRVLSNGSPDTYGPFGYVLRLNTQGGTAPTQPCSAANVNAEVRSPYYAEYYFIQVTIN
jgi:Protein of unknown function (DUF3455)